jgi:Flp pilus assembly protein TadG
VSRANVGVRPSAGPPAPARSLGERGSLSLESVLVLPVLALLVVGVLEVAAVTRDVLVAHEAARAGARAAATSTGTAAVERAARQAAPELEEVVVLVDPVTRRDGDVVRVTVSSRRAVLGVPTTVRASAVARVEPAVGTRRPGVVGP